MEKSLQNPKRELFQQLARIGADERGAQNAPAFTQHQFAEALRVGGGMGAAGLFEVIH